MATNNNKATLLPSSVYSMNYLLFPHYHSNCEQQYKHIDLPYNHFWYNKYNIIDHLKIFSVRQGMKPMQVNCLWQAYKRLEEFMSMIRTMNSIEYRFNHNNNSYH